jgi:hypothetical protein
VVTVTVPVAVPELSVSGDDGPVQEGRSLAPLGEEVSAQLNVTVPAYPSPEVTVIVSVAVPPGVTDDGETVPAEAP